MIPQRYAGPEIGVASAEAFTCQLRDGGRSSAQDALLSLAMRLEGEEEQVSSGGQKRNGLSFASVIIQILLLDVVFSLDSVITAVGMVDQLSVMIAAVVVSVCAMVFLTGVISDFVNRHPTVKMLALSFLLLIGFTLIVEGLHQRSRQHGEVSLKSSSGCSGSRRWSGLSLVPPFTAFSAARANKPLAV
uniref:TerC family protein n=1 Tax=Candidatus Electronema sp. TaxID=2698783 RepID=UPI004055EB32